MEPSWQMDRLCGGWAPRYRLAGNASHMLRCYHRPYDEKQFHDLLAKFSCKGVGHQMTLIFADQKKREGEGGALTRWSIGPQTIQTALWPSFQPQNCPKPFSISTKTCAFTQKVIMICRIDRIHYSFRRSVIWRGHKVKVYKTASVEHQ